MASVSSISLYHRRLAPKLETNFHENLYDNLALLKMIYPTSPEFDAVLKRDMFTKNNRAAFQQVAYYLFNLINPELTKEKLNSWPPYDIKLETKLRNEIIALTIAMRDLYPDVDLPILLTSHLIAPGGCKIVKYLFKLSQLALLEHLKRGDNAKKDEIQKPVNPGKNSEINKLILDDLNSKIDSINRSTHNVLDDFENLFQKSSVEAENIIATQTSLNHELPLLETNYESKRQDLEEANSDLDLEIINLNISEINDYLNYLSEVTDRSEKCKQLLSSILGNDYNLVFNESTLTLPTEIAHLQLTSDGVLNLNSLLNALNTLLECRNLEMPNLSSLQLKNMIGNLQEEYEKVVKDENKILELLEKIRGVFGGNSNIEE